MGDLFDKFDPIIAEKAALLATGVNDPFNLVMEHVHSPTEATVNGRETILVGTYNYMGMTFDPDVIAAGNIGCMMQIGSATQIPIVHTVELLDWATGGPKPPALARPSQQGAQIPMLR